MPCVLVWREWHSFPCDFLYIFNHTTLLVLPIRRAPFVLFTCTCVSCSQQMQCCCQNGPFWLVAGPLSDRVWWSLLAVKHAVGLLQLEVNSTACISCGCRGNENVLCAFLSVHRASKHLTALFGTDRLACGIVLVPDVLVPDVWGRVACGTVFRPMGSCVA